MPGSEPERVPGVSPTPEGAMRRDDVTSRLLRASSVEVCSSRALPLQGEVSP